MLHHFEMSMLVMFVFPAIGFLGQVAIDKLTGNTFKDALHEMAYIYRSAISFYIPCGAFSVAVLTLGLTWEHLLGVYLAGVALTWVITNFWVLEDLVPQPDSVEHFMNDLYVLRMSTITSIGSFFTLGYMLNASNFLRKPVHELTQ